MRDLRRYWINRSSVNCSTIFVLFAAALLVACDRADAPTEIPLPDAPAPEFSNGERSPNANPFTFIEREDGGACGDEYPAGSRIVSAAWLGGMGLPDNGALNFPQVITEPGDLPAKDDPHYGLLLSKNGRTEVCASAGAVIVGVKGEVLSGISDLGFDLRNGTHCGAGAPRFNVVVKDPETNLQSFHFVGGCANGTQTPAPQDPTEWIRVRISTSNPAQAFPVIPANSIVQSITILYDEGTDTPTLQDPNGVGLAVVDNIWIDGEFIRSGGGIAFGAGGLEKNDPDADGLTNDVDSDDDNDGIDDLIDTDDDGDGIDDTLGLKLMAPLLDLQL